MGWDWISEYKIIQQQMSISQSRANSRGPLIAVIKIEIENDQVDRIFLHQNDDDYKLAQQFQQKHQLNPLFVDHIYHKIRASRESLLKDNIANKSTFPLHSDRSLNNRSNYPPTPIQNARENPARNAHETFATPFDRIQKFTPVEQEAKDQYRVSINDTYSNTIQEQNDRNSFKRQIGQEKTRNNYQPDQDKRNSIFQTFMESNKTKSNQELFDKFLRERKQNHLPNQPKLIVKQKADTNSNSFLQSREANESQKQIRPNSIEINKAIRLNESTQNNKTCVESHYSFNQDKPERVKILRKEQIQSLQSSKKSLNKIQKQKIAKEVTNRLYNESEIKKNYLNKIKERAKQEKQEKQDKELTYRPQINKVSTLIAADRYKDIPIQDYLIDKAKKSQVKKEAERALKAQKQLQNCSFKPQLNVISQKLVRNASRGHLKDSHNNTLDDCSRKHSQSQMAFRPSLNKMSEKIVKSKGQGGFQQRLKQYLEQKNSRLNELTKEKKARQKVDESGQELFRPRVNSKPANRSPKGSQIHDYLYQMSKIDKSIPREQQKPTINQNSEQIIQQLHMKRIAWIFCELDSDQDGLISPKRTCISTIGEDVLEVISPVLIEMEDMDISLSLQDFRRAIQNLHPSLNAHQKAILYSYGGRHNQNERQK